MKFKDRVKVAFTGKLPEQDISEKSASVISPFMRSLVYGGSGSRLSASGAMDLWSMSDACFTAIDLIAMPFSQMTYSLKDKKTGEYISNPDDHPLLALLDNPGYLQSGDEVMYGLMTSFLAAGVCYPQALGNVKYEPTQLKMKFPNKVSLMTDKEDELMRIIFSSGTQETFNRELIPKRKIAVYQADSKLSETIPIMKIKQQTGHDASSPLARVFYQAYTKYYGLMHNNGLLKNGSRPNSMYSVKEPLGQDQWDAFKTDFKENFTGPKNAGRDIVSPVPLDIQQLHLSTKDMDFVELINSSATDIYNIYHIPLALIAKETMTMSNFENSMTALYDMAVLPNAYMLLKALGDFLLPRYKDGDRYELTFDEKTLPALRARMLDTGKKMREIQAFTEDEIRGATGFEQIEGGSDVWKQSTWVPAGEEEEDLTGVDMRDDEDGELEE